MSNIVFLDTETTGLNPRRDRIVEIAAIEFSETFKPLRVFHEYLDPECPVGFSEKIHGLSDAFLAGRKRFADIAGALATFLDGRTVIAHNLPFDESFINASYARCGFANQLSEDNDTIDSLALAKTKFDGRVSLDALVKRFKLDGSARKDHHGALVDAQLLAKVYACLVNKRIKAMRIDYSEIDAYDRLYQQSCDPKALKEMAFNVEQYWDDDFGPKIEALIALAEQTSCGLDMDLLTELQFQWQSRGSLDEDGIEYIVTAIEDYDVCC